MRKGRLFLISGPSGSGKDTLLTEVFARRPEIRFSISSVTRPMRAGETADGKYRFLSRETFLEQLAADEFLEYNEYDGNYYGTPRAPVEECIRNGADMILEIDVNGAAKVRAQLPETVSIFLMPPSVAELRRRLAKRGTESAAHIEARVASAIEEIRRAGEYDYIVVNDDLDRAVADFLTILESDRLKTDRQQQKIDEVLQIC